jgi:phenylalanyl-tRNA synthetase alpha chain
VTTIEFDRIFDLVQFCNIMSNQFTLDFADLSTVSACLEKRDELANSQAFGDLKSMLGTATKEQKIELGQKLNVLKKDLYSACDTKIQEIQSLLEQDNFNQFDPTFHSDKYITNSGVLHPLTLVMNEIVEIFEKMGFSVADGPLVETQKTCFTDLNMPSYHPARSMQDTFFLEQKDNIGENYVMRTHTSGVQIRYANEFLKNKKPPIRVVIPGQVYRNEKIDATHDIMFHQIECLVIDKRVSVSHLKTLVEDFYQQFFGISNLEARFRPSYFPYTVPSLEVDITNPFKPGTWLEVGGSGLVHPDVIRNYGLDPEEYQGLAFGFGIDRMAQLKLGLSGLGQFFEGNLKFLAGK